MTEYEKRELDKARKRAAEQMKDMQRRADMTKNKPSHEDEKNRGEAFASPQKNNETENKGFNLLSMLNLKHLKFDNDIMLILVLFFLLSSDDSDELLLLALLYIML